MRFQGAAKLYHCFADESLNASLRDVAQFCHRLTFNRRVFSLMDLKGRFSGVLAAAGPWLPLVSGWF
eukprot:4531963-Pyramimonas_sp.AAC.2